MLENLQMNQILKWILLENLQINKILNWTLSQKKTENWINIFVLHFVETVKINQYFWIKFRRKTENELILELDF